MTARNLDIEITKITPKTVYYKLWLGKSTEHWRISPQSVFNTSVLQVGKRYSVTTIEIRAEVFDHKAQDWIWKDGVYEWVTATERKPKDRPTARSKAQRERDEEREAMPLVGADLFQF